MLNCGKILNGRYFLNDFCLKIDNIGMECITSLVSGLRSKMIFFMFTSHLHEAKKSA